MISKPYTIPHTVMVQSVDDEILLFDSATELFFSLNDTGAMMWDSISAYHDLSDVYDELLETFEVAPEQLESDLELFVASLAEQGLVVFVK
ncbi:PqqD family protein [Sulfuricurvum sp.]|uniref:PqqD family protein n=1 Tax=Sulfuricurvum sp. TaxID=2025608 RepID=UPI002610D126|nr:PqqD family protein [Sulfuricurvum sp.]MDD2781644.1 PqqD family protein [Sulfuricurvum sp.]